MYNVYLSLNIYLDRSLLFIAGLHKLIAENDNVSPICYLVDLVGYIFCSAFGQVTKNEVLSLSPLGMTISYITCNVCAHVQLYMPIK